MLTRNKILVGHVSALHRYPVKSMHGETLPQATIIKQGLLGDRNWIMRDDDTKELSIVRKDPTLLNLRAQYLEQPTEFATGFKVKHVRVQFPDGEFYTSHTPAVLNSRLSDYIGKSVSLWPLQPITKLSFFALKTMPSGKAFKRYFLTGDVFPSFASITWGKLFELGAFVTPLGRYYDAYPLHIITSSSQQHLKSLAPEADVRASRFRPNIEIKSTNDTNDFEEFHWVGGTLFIGSTKIKCVSPTVRCLMPAQPQLGLDKNPKLVKAMSKYTDRHFGINAAVKQAGIITVDDAVYWLPERFPKLKKQLRYLSGKLKNIYIKVLFASLDKIRGL